MGAWDSGEESGVDATLIWIENGVDVTLVWIGNWELENHNHNPNFLKYIFIFYVEWVPVPGVKYTFLYQYLYRVIGYL